MFSESVIDMCLFLERERRILAEGPPDGEVHIIEDTSGLGIKQKIRMGGRYWNNNNPCVKCTDEECFNQINYLSDGAGIRYTGSICKNPLNDELIRVLCNWRKHVVDTKLEKWNPVKNKWEKINICTSVLTFLGRKKDKGGIIPIIASYDNHVNSISSLVSVDGVKGLSGWLVMFIGMYMDGMNTLDRVVHPWELYTVETKNIITSMVNRVRQKGQKGLECYSTSVWSVMFRCIMNREKIPDDVREIILSKGHLP